MKFVRRREAGSSFCPFRRNAFTETRGFFADNLAVLLITTYHSDAVQKIFDMRRL